MKTKCLFGAIAALILFAALAMPVHAAQFVENTTAPFGTFNGVEYVIHSGRFEGTTSLGNFRVPYEIVAPADPTQGDSTLLVEPPHWFYRTFARDFTPGRDVLFNRGMRYATVGFTANGFSILDIFADDLIIEGKPVVPPVTFGNRHVDEEIIVQFTQALAADPFTSALLGPIDRRYAFGVSQTAAVLQEIQYQPFGQGLFDLTFLYLTLWRPRFGEEGIFDFLPDGSPTPVPFDPPIGAGRVIFVASEGDQIVSDSEFFRSAADLPDYRLYEVAGTAHVPFETNPLDHAPVMRALFVRGDEWMLSGAEPPTSVLLAEDTSGANDPVYGFPTGIARDADLNALGGVRLPDLEVGRAQYIASDDSIEPLPGLAGLLGNTVDLTCSADGTQRFKEHGDYVSRFVAQVNALVAQGFLLAGDAEGLKEQAAESDIGKPDSCQN